MTGKKLYKPQYVVQRIRGTGEVSGPKHASVDVQNTLCGLSLNTNWFITENNGDMSTVDCPRCKSKVERYDNNRIELTYEGWERFCELLETPPKASDKLKEAMRGYTIGCMASQNKELLDIAGQLFELIENAADFSNGIEFDGVDQGRESARKILKGLWERYNKVKG